mmetsp:Transcript_27608/g.61664  ORF Transcript_27608/g.61664 Transcript_27608/m.61664 type:complete len:216 (+) Transcript_27608:80-727(+)
MGNIFVLGHLPEPQMPGIKPVIQCPPLESNAESRTETGASEQAARGVANNGPKLSNPLGQVRLHQGPDAAPDQAVPERPEFVAHVAHLAEPEPLVVPHQDSVLPLVVQNGQKLRPARATLDPEAGGHPAQQKPEAVCPRAGRLFGGALPVQALVALTPLPVTAEPANLHRIQMEETPRLHEPRGVPDQVPVLDHDHVVRLPHRVPNRPLEGQLGR